MTKLTQTAFPSLTPLGSTNTPDHTKHSPEGWLRQAEYWESRGAKARADNCFHMALLAEGDRTQPPHRSLPKDTTHDQAQDEISAG